MKIGLYEDFEGTKPLGGLFTKKAVTIGSVNDKTIYVRNSAPYELEVEISVGGAHAKEVSVLEGAKLKIPAKGVDKVVLRWIPSTEFEDEHFNASLKAYERYVV